MTTATKKQTSRTKATTTRSASKRTASKRRTSGTADPSSAVAPEIRQHIHLICKQEMLSEAFAFVKAAVPNRTNQPVLTSVLLAASETNQQVTLMASDLTVTMTATLEAQVISSGEISLPAEILADVVSKCPTGMLTLTTQTNAFQETGNSAVDYHAQLVDKQNGVTDLRGMDANEFPPIASIAAKQIELPAKVVKAGIQGAMFAICTDEEKRILTGLNWVLNPTQQMLKCTATDRHQVAMISRTGRTALRTNGADQCDRLPTNRPCLSVQWLQRHRKNQYSSYFCQIAQLPQHRTTNGHALWRMPVLSFD